MPHTVVLGAGIIGLSTAHALAALAPADHKIHLVDPAPRLFASASGHAAGFIARDWFAPATAALGALSFDLHRELAKTHDGASRWAYAPSVSYSLDHTYRPDDTPPAHPGTVPAANGTDGADLSPLDTQHCYTRSSSESTTPTISNAECDSQEKDELEWLRTGTSRTTSLDDATVSDTAFDGLRASPCGGAGPAWLRAHPEALEALSDHRTTAQV